MNRQGKTLVLFDGVCGICNRLTMFLLARDSHARIHFAALQSVVAKPILARHGRSADLDTVYVIADWGTSSERVLDRSQAILYAVRQTGGGWGAAARVASALPVRLADAAYAFMARHRYRIFRRFNACPIPPPPWRARFLDRE
jgi:predicted DCC family thiol-disulfide oxidoreductase YuxK